MNNINIKGEEYIQFNKVIYYLDQIEKTLDNNENKSCEKKNKMKEQIKVKKLKMNDYLKHSIQSIKSVISNEGKESHLNKDESESKFQFSDDDLTDTVEENNVYDSSSSLSDSDGTLADSDTSLLKKSSLSSLSLIKNQNELKKEYTLNLEEEEVEEGIENNNEKNIIFEPKENESTSSIYLNERKNTFDVHEVWQRVKSLQKEQSMLINIIKDQTRNTIKESLIFDNDLILADHCLMDAIERDTQYLDVCEENVKSFVNETIRDYNILLAEKDVEIEEKQEIIDELREKLENKDYSGVTNNEYEVLLEDMMEQMKNDDEYHTQEVTELKNKITELESQYLKKIEQLDGSVDELNNELYQKEKEKNELLIKFENINKENETLKTSQLKKEEEFSQQYKKLKDQNDKFKNLAIEIKNSITSNKEKYNETIDSLHKVVKQKDEALAFSNNRINDYKLNIAKLNEEIKLMQKKMDNEHYQFKKEFSKLKNIIRDNEEQIESLEEKVSNTERINKRTKDKYERKLKEIRVSSTKEAEGLWYVIDTREKEIDSLNTTMSDLVKEKERLENENEVFIKQHSEDMEYIERIRKENNEKIEELNKTNQKIKEDYEQKYKELDKEQNVLKEKLQDMTCQIQKTEEKQILQEKENKNLQQLINSLENNYKEKEEQLKCENVQVKSKLTNEIQRITENLKNNEIKYKEEIKEMEIRKTKKINKLLSTNKELEEKYKLEREQKNMIAKYIRDKNHEDVILSKKKKNDSHQGITTSMKNINERMNVYQKMLTTNSSISTKTNSFNLNITKKINEQNNKYNNNNNNNTLKTKGLILLKVFQNL